MSELLKLRFRSYVWTDDGPSCLPQSTYHPDQPALFAHLAGGRHRSLSVEWYMDGDRPSWSWTARFLSFDPEGRLDRMAMMRGAVSTRNYANAARKAAESEVVELGPFRTSKDAHEAQIWDPTPAQLARIEADLLPAGHPDRNPIPVAKQSEPGNIPAPSPRGPR